MMQRLWRTNIIAGLHVSYTPPLDVLHIQGYSVCNPGINPGIENPMKQPMATDQAQRQRIGFIGLRIR